MGKLLQCDGAPLLEPLPQPLHGPGPASSLDPWLGSLQVSIPPPDDSSVDSLSSLFDDDDEASASPSWDAVPGLEPQQRQALLKLASKGVFWKHPTKAVSCVLTLHHGGDVDADGNCLFTATQKAMSLQDSPQQVRLKAVRRFLRNYEDERADQAAIDRAIHNLYTPDLASGWGVHVVQEVKLLAKKDERESLDRAVQDLVQCGVSREEAAETIYKERCISIRKGEDWVKFMSVAGNANDEYDIITLLYTQEGLVSIDENREGRAAAFGDDIAIESLASEYNREIFVVQAHGADAMVDEEHCVFFLSHRPLGEVQHSPAFLFMKGTGWCGSGADHYEPLIARLAPSIPQDKVALVL